jgi:MOSC domain-containing protein YiiM
MSMKSPAAVVAVSRDGKHRFSKLPAAQIVLLAGLGVRDDVHAGVTVQHRCRVAADPSGENVTTRGVDLLGLPRGTVLRVGPEAAVEVTGLRNPCRQINRFQPGLLEAVLDRAPDGELVRKAGIMGVVLAGGTVRPGDAITVELPAAPHQPLAPV